MKILSALLFTFSLALPAFAGDVSSAFVPEEGQPIEVSGQLDGENMSCESSKTEASCGDAFDKVHDIVAGQFAATIRGTINEAGQENRQVVFSIGTLSYNGKEVRIIFEYDETRDAAGVIWIDPAQM